MFNMNVQALVEEHNKLVKLAQDAIARTKEAVTADEYFDAWFEVEMIQAEIIQPSSSPYNSPLNMLKRKMVQLE